MEKIFAEENGVYQIDLTNTVTAIGDLNRQYSQIGHFLSEVDFIAETQDTIYLIEYKNTDIERGDPVGLLNKISDGSFATSIIKKYYGGMFYVMATGVTSKKVSFILILECEKADPVVRKKIRTQSKKRLPFKLQNDSRITSNLIDEFLVLSIKEWNEKYPQFPLTRIER